MKKSLLAAISMAAMGALAGPAFADGELHIYNWGNYTNPKLIEKFEKQYSVKVTLDDYDSNETMLSKVRTARRLVDSGELTVVVEIDGGINADTIEAAAEAGVDCFVAGSAVYGAGDPAAAVAALRRQAGAASPHLRL